MLHLAVDRNVVQDRQVKPLIDVPLVRRHSTTHFQSPPLPIIGT